MKYLSSLGVLAALLAASGANAETLASCGPQSGRAYYVEGGAVGKKDSGWAEDRISKGATALVRDSKGAYDIVFSDSTGTEYSAVAQGGAVVVQRMSPTEATIIVSYPLTTVEIYQFIRDASGKALMLQLQSKGEKPIAKSGVYYAACDVLNLG